MIEFREDQPRWQQVADVVKSRITAGHYRPGSRIPSENDLMQEFGIARMTAHKVMRALRAEGAIYTVRGLGSFVSPQGDGDEGGGRVSDDPNASVSDPA